MNLPKREELSFLTVFALPKDSSNGFVLIIFESKSLLDCEPATPVKY